MNTATQATDLQRAIRAYVYGVDQCRKFPIDACTDAAEFWGIPVAKLAAELIAAGYNGRGLSLIC
jgi:hypothetical protein